MLPDERSERLNDAGPAVRFYKSKHLSPPIIYVQKEGAWESYAPDGAIRESAGAISDTILNQAEAVDENEAKELIRLRLLEAEQRERERTEDLMQGPSGLGGWLVLPIVGLFATIITAAVSMYFDIVPALNADTWSLLTEPGMHRLWAPLFVFEAFCTVVLLLVPVALLILLFMKRRVLQRLIIWFYGFAFLVLIAESVIILVFGKDMLSDAGIREQLGWTTSGVVVDLVRGVVPTAIWIPYFLFSRRVKNTFVNPPIVESHPQRVPLNGQPPAPKTVAAVAEAPAPLAVEGTSPAAPPASSPRPSRHALVWVLVAFLAALLVAVGILAWRSIILSDEVGDLSGALARATSTSTTRSTSTTANPWGAWGSSDAYQQYLTQFQAIAARREGLVTETNKLNEQSAGHSKYAFRVDGDQELINMIQALPDAPKEVQSAQDEYLGILIREQYAFQDLVKSGSAAWEQLDGIFPEEYRLFLAWQQALNRSL